MSTPFILDRPDIVFEAVCATLIDVFPHLSRESLVSRERSSAGVAWLRQVGMYLLSIRLQAGAAETGRRFLRDRATVIHASRVVAGQAAYRPATAALIDLLDAHTRARLDELAAAEAEFGVI